MAPPRVLNIPAGAPFLASFVEALLAGDIIPGLSRANGPLAFADTRIFVPTQRAARALLTEFSHAAQRSATQGRSIQGGAIILPHIKPLGAVDEEASLLSDEGDNVSFDAAIPDAISDLERRFLLANLIWRWAQALPQAIATPPESLGALDGGASLVGATPADAFSLARALAGLIDEFIIEGAPWEAVRHLAADDFDVYWSLTTRFLQIAVAEWPGILLERGKIDASDQRNRMIAREIATFTGAPSQARPMIVLGSTGTNKATAALMSAIAQSPLGAIVLPGLDPFLSDTQWRALTESSETGEPFGHPQRALAHLLRRLQISREDVRMIGEGRQRQISRVKFLSQALALPEATAGWRHYVRDHRADIAQAFDGVALLEARDEREEALAIAICLREALERDGVSAALVTPDRSIARRVRVELMRWNIAVDDSGGEPLGVTEAGAFALQTLAAAAGPSDIDLVALLAMRHVAPDAEGLEDRAAIALCAQNLESAVLRATPHIADFSRRVLLARDAAALRHAHPAVRRLNDEDWGAMAHLAGAIVEALSPLTLLRGARPFAHWAAAHRITLARLAANADRAMREDDEALRNLLEALSALKSDAQSQMCLDLAQYHALFAVLANDLIVRGPRRNHPRIKILGLLEARLLDADLIVLAGLDETIWPPQPKSDPFLNRAMRAQLGLSPPERRIGQSAHDFTMLMGSPNVVLTRAQKRGGTPMTPSRFLQRIAALGGGIASAAGGEQDATPYQAAIARGNQWLGLARALDRSEKSVSLPRPSPKPPLALRPRALSVTRIETLWRDPYAIYAERILKLAPLGALDAALDRADQGIAVHAVLQALTETWPSGALPPDARARALEIAQNELRAFFDDPAWRAFRWPEIEAGVDYVLRYEARRRGALDFALAEAKGQISLPLADGSDFLLTAVADRLEVDTSGHVRVVDFKTGVAPSIKQVKAGFASQLTLTAAMIEQGAFAKLGPLPIDSVVYLKLGGAGGGKEVNPAKSEPLPELIATHWRGMMDMLNGFRDVSRGYPSRPRVQFSARYGDYDHLARVKEWMTSGAESEP